LSLIQRPKYALWSAQRRHSPGHGISYSTVKTDILCQTKAYVSDRRWKHFAYNRQ